MKFAKDAQDLPSQVALLKFKGLVISDDAEAESLLANIGYYRFSAYTFPFRDRTDPEHFKDGTTFTQVMRVYNFDRALRLLVNDAIERIEISLRSRIVNETCLHHSDPHWFMDPAHFHRRFDHGNFLRKIERDLKITYDPTTKNRILPSRHPETFIEHYYRKYADPYLPPFWMTAETLTLGTLSHFYKGIDDSSLKGTIAQAFGVPTKVFVSWLHAMTHLRNVCAHHGRLWNRVFSITPMVAHKHNGIINDPKRFNASAVVVVDLLDICSPGHSWRTRFKALLTNYPEIDPLAMGFSRDWLTETFWK